MGFLAAIQEILRLKNMILGFASTLHEQDKIELAYKEKVLKSFFKYGRLVKIPVQKKKRQWVMEKIANNFLPNKNYSITTATKLLSEIYEDTGLLLKELQSCGYLDFDNGVIKRK